MVEKLLCQFSYWERYACLENKHSKSWFLPGHELQQQAPGVKKLVKKTNKQKNSKPICFNFGTVTHTRQ